MQCMPLSMRKRASMRSPCKPLAGRMSMRISACSMAHRKVPRDLTEATLAGGTISLMSTVVMAYLFITNFSAFLNVDTKVLPPCPALVCATEPRHPPKH